MLFPTLTNTCTCSCLQPVNKKGRRKTSSYGNFEMGTAILKWVQTVFVLFLFRSLILSYVYIFCYINVEDTKTKPRIIIFYTVTFIENVLLVVLWTLSVKASLDFEKSERQTVIISVVVLFVIGICFMLLYYQLFHVSKLGSGNGNGDQVPNGLNCRSSLVPNDKSHSTGNCNQV